MKNLLVPIEEHNIIDAVIDTALAVARRFDSYVEGIAVSVDQISAYAADLHFGVVPGLDPVSRQEMADAARHRFENAMMARGMARAAPAQTASGFGWRQDLLTGDELVGAYARVFDLTVVGRPSNRAGHPRMATLEAALFDSGRPVLLVPPSPFSDVGAEIVIAWNRSTETARAVAQAMPFLKRARNVTVLDVENWGVEGPSGKDLLGCLERHGLPARLYAVPAGSKGHGEAILVTAKDLGCDLLVKGAYTQSRLRQMIFGGATSYILANTSLPVLLAH
jgi:nucleotide-binding universal stress UspA family protein